MSEKNANTAKAYNGGSISLAIALLFIAFWGEPDLIDAIVFALTGEYPR